MSIYLNTKPFLPQRLERQEKKRLGSLPFLARDATLKTARALPCIRLILSSRSLLAWKTFSRHFLPQSQESSWDFI